MQGYLRRFLKGSINHFRPSSKTRAITSRISNSSSNANNNGTSVVFAISISLLASTTLASNDSHSEPMKDANNANKNIQLSTTKIYRRADISSHNNLDSGIWVTYKNGVYDITSFLANHPGGRERLMLAAGKDLSEFWTIPAYRQHFRSPLAFELLEDMRVGTLHTDDIISINENELEKLPLNYPANIVYDCIVIGSGVSGLMCAKTLTTKHHIPSSNVLILEAQDYVGGRVRQVSDFVKGVNVDVGAEFLHGNNTLLTKFARENDEKLKEIFCWVSYIHTIPPLPPPSLPPHAH